jgi:hypothetical protein
MIIYGTRSFGKVDQVANLFHVSTRFFHMIPLGSHVVLAETSERIRGVPIGLSAKSWLKAWLTGAAVVAIFVGGFGAYMEYLEGHRWGPLAIVGSLGVLALMLVTQAKTFRRASYARAKQLAEKIGASDEGRLEIARIYAEFGDYEASMDLHAMENAQPVAQTP